MGKFKLKPSRKVYIYAGYFPAGGTFMVYHLGLICAKYYGFDPIVVTIGDETQQNSFFQYDEIFPIISENEFEEAINENDVLICNPSFSYKNFGLRLKGFKISYIQGFTTFQLLDRFFDHYVSVGNHLNLFLKSVYNLDTNVIHPFITTKNSNLDILEWGQRERLLTLRVKGENGLLLLNRLEELLQNNNRNLYNSINWKELQEDTMFRGNQNDMLKKIASSKYLLNISAAEGFGLVPLEAMSMGTIPIGFDGFGGRDYMYDGVNCISVKYPNISQLAEKLETTLFNNSNSKFISDRARLTSQKYNYHNFVENWCKELSSVFANQ